MTWTEIVMRRLARLLDHTEEKVADAVFEPPKCEHGYPHRPDPYVRWDDDNDDIERMD